MLPIPRTVSFSLLLLLFVAAWPSLLVAQQASAVALAASPDPSTFGAPVLLTATVTPAVATGLVTFYDGTSILGISAITNGQATLTTRLLAIGSRSLRVHYAGDAVHSFANSAVAA